MGESSLTSGNQIADIGLGVHLIRSSSDILSKFNLVGLRVDESKAKAIKTEVKEKVKKRRKLNDGSKGGSKKTLNDFFQEGVKIEVQQQCF